MNFLDYIRLIKRHAVWAGILTILIVVTAVWAVSLRNNAPFETTVFMSIGINSQNESKDAAYGNVQASDQFSETVMGWFKNPSFQKRIKSPGTTEMNARKQEKQNILVTFNSEQTEEGQRAGEKLKSELDKEIAAYNDKTHSEFQIAIYALNTEEKRMSLGLFAIIAFIGGMIFSSFAIYGYENLLGKIITEEQAVEISKRQPIETVNAVTVKKEKLHFLSAYLNNIESRDIQIMGVGVAIKNLQKTLEESIKNKNVTYIKFPEESGEILKNSHFVAICVLGKTSTEDLRKIQTLTGNTFDLVIVES